MGGDIFALLGMLLTVVCILALAYFFTKYLARWKLGSPRSLSKGSHMRSLDQLTIGADLRLLLVQVGGRYLLLGLSPAGITSLAELSAEEAALWDADEPTSTQSDMKTPSFRDAFLTSLKQKRK